MNFMTEMPNKPRSGLPLDAYEAPYGRNAFTRLPELKMLKEAARKISCEELWHLA
jgi:hypothetical protein